MKIDHCKRTTIIIFLFSGLLTAQMHFPLYVIDSLEFTSSNLPIVVIDTHGETIVDEVRVEADMGIINNSAGQRNYLTDPFNDYNGKIAIELRGSTSLNFPKKSYRIETQDSLGNNLNVSLLGMPRENDWVLYGPWNDRSLIRNVLAYKLSNDIGRYASRTRVFELILNGEYHGLYILLEKIKRDRNRVNISRMDSNDVAGDSLTGGYIIKLDKWWSGEYNEYWTSALSVTYQYHYPKEYKIVPEQKAYIQNFVDDFETVMNGTEYNDPIKGFLKYIDLASFADHFIINEFCRNVDAYRVSAYMYKDRDSKSGKLNMGPIWDFNLSFGKAWWPFDEHITEGWCVDKKDHPEVPFWWVKLGHDSSFAERVVTRWNELRSGILQKITIYSTIDSLVDSLAEARTRNFNKWEQSVNYEEEIQLLKQWISDRIEWIDSNLNTLTSVYEIFNSKNFPETFSVEQNYPNPFNSFTTINYNLTKKSHIMLKIYSITGYEIRTLVNEVQNAGKMYATWDGKDNSGKSVSSGVYVYRIVVKNEKISNKMLLIK